MVPWGRIACSVFQFIGSSITGYIAGAAAKTSNQPPQQIGVEDHPSLNPIVEVINSTNTRIDALYDQHNHHRSEVQQFLWLGAGICLSLVIIVICVIGVGCCCWCKLKKSYEKQSTLNIPPFGSPARVAEIGDTKV